MGESKIVQVRAFGPPGVIVKLNFNIVGLGPNAGKAVLAGTEDTTSGDLTVEASPTGGLQTFTITFKKEGKIDITLRTAPTGGRTIASKTMTVQK